MWTEVGQTPQPLDLGAWSLDDPGVKSPEASSPWHGFQTLLSTLNIISWVESDRPDKPPGTPESVSEMS